MRRAIPGCIAAISSTVSVPCFVVARTREPGIGGSSMAAETASGSRTFRVSGLGLLNHVLEHRVRSVHAGGFEQVLEIPARSSPRHTRKLAIHTTVVPPVNL